MLKLSSQCTGNCACKDKSRHHDLAICHKHQTCWVPAQNDRHRLTVRLAGVEVPCFGGVACICGCSVQPRWLRSTVGLIYAVPGDSVQFLCAVSQSRAIAPLFVPRAKCIRMLFAELTRVLDHLLGISCPPSAHPGLQNGKPQSLHRWNAGSGRALLGSSVPSVVFGA
jgi:hypothetical protein